MDILTYQRWPGLGLDAGLLLDEITHADHTGDFSCLDTCLTDVLGQYRTVIGNTVRPATFDKTVTKLYGDRAAHGARLDHYYANNPQLLVLPDGTTVRASELARMRVTVNDREHRINLTTLREELGLLFTSRNPTWAALTQGDPTDLNLGWSPNTGPVWFDYDTAGLNSIAGEFACFLAYQRLHGSWLTPTYNRAAFRDHPMALSPATLARPSVHLDRDGKHGLRIDYTHQPSPARRHVLRRYLNELVHPINMQLAVDDLMTWLRPYLVMRLLAVYNIAQLSTLDTALSLALLAEALDTNTNLTDFLGLATEAAS